MAAQRGSPRAASYFHISDNLYIKFDNNDKKGNLGNQWQSLISSQLSNIEYCPEVRADINTKEASQSLTTLCVNFVLVTRANFSKIYIEIFASVGKRIKNTFVICFNIKMQEKRVIFF